MEKLFTHAVPHAQNNRMLILRTVTGFFFVAGAAAMIVMSFKYFLSSQTGILRGNEIKSSVPYLILFRLHVGGGLLAILIGSLQFFKWVRERGIRLHKILGITYVTAIFISSTTGLIIAQFAMGGTLASSGFSVLSVIWFYTTWRALQYGKLHDRDKHRNWIMRSYALTFAAITQRTLLLVPLLTGVSFINTYRLSAWLPWIFNLLIAEIITRQRRSLQSHP